LLVTTGLHRSIGLWLRSTWRYECFEVFDCPIKR